MMQHAVRLIHELNHFVGVDVLNQVLRAQSADAVICEWPNFFEVGVDWSIVNVDPFPSRRRVDSATEIEATQTLALPEKDGEVLDESAMDLPRQLLDQLLVLQPRIVSVDQIFVENFFDVEKVTHAHLIKLAHQL